VADRTPEAGQTAGAPAATPHPTPAGAPAVPRALKLVARLAPAGDGGFRAELGVGADGCDPLFRVLDVPDLAAALAALPALVAEAGERWRDQPRYPAAQQPPRPASGARPAATPAPAGQAPAPAAGPRPSPDAPSAASAAPQAQLSLFG